MVFLDLDGFKPVNDVHGHDAGDQVLIAVAARLSAAVRPGDAVGRYGGDEFVVVCRGVPPGTRRPHRGAASTQRHRRIRGLRRRRVDRRRLDRHRPPRPWGRPASVLRRADQAMFEAKRARRRARSLDTRR